MLPPDISQAEMTEPQQHCAVVRIAEEVHEALVKATEREWRRDEEVSFARRLRE